VALTADGHAHTPIGPLPNTVNVGILLGGLPRANVTATLTSGDPVAPHLDEYLREYVHRLYAADGPTFPHTVTRLNQTVTYLSINAYLVDVIVDLFDDQSDPAHRIEVARPPGQV